MLHTTRASQLTYSVKSVFSLKSNIFPYWGTLYSPRLPCSSLLKANTQLRVLIVVHFVLPVVYLVKSCIWGDQTSLATTIVFSNVLDDTAQLPVLNESYSKKPAIYVAHCHFSLRPSPTVGSLIKKSVN